MADMKATGNGTVKTTATAKLTEENLKKWVAEKKGIRFMAEQTGAAREDIKAMLTKLGLKTRSMTEAQSRKSVSFKSMMAVYNAIANGAQDIEMARMATDLPLEVVTSAVARMKRDGTVKNVLAVVVENKVAEKQPEATVTLQ